MGGWCRWDVQVRFSPEIRERGGPDGRGASGGPRVEWAVLQSVAPKLGCTAETLRKWVRQAQRDAGHRPGLTTSERERLQELREVRELKRANEILRKASAVFCSGGARPPRQVMVQFITDHRDTYGVEPIRAGLPIAPSTYHRSAGQLDPSRRSARAPRDTLRVEIQCVYDEHHQVYGPRKVWKQLPVDRGSFRVRTRCTWWSVESRRCVAESRGMVRGPRVRSTNIRRLSWQRRPPGRSGRPPVSWRSQAVQLWVADFTYVATWSGFATSRS